MSTAWVLRGGASFGAAQVGMARALMEAGHYPDMLFGVSAGSLNATWLAADPTLAGLPTLAALWDRVQQARVFALRPWTLVAGLSGLSDHVVSAARLSRWLRSVTGLRRLEDGVVPLTVVATDVENGREVLLDRGPAVQALMASCAMPGIYPPVRVEDRWLIDGGVALDTPIGPAVNAGATSVFVLPSVPAGPMRRPRGAIDMMLRSSSILLSRHHDVRVEAWCDRCQLYVLPAPVVPGVSPFDFRHSSELISAAYSLAKDWLTTAKPVVGAANRYGQEYHEIGDRWT